MVGLGGIYNKVEVEIAAGSRLELNTAKQLWCKINNGRDTQY